MRSIYGPRSSRECRDPKTEPVHETSETTGQENVGLINIAKVSFRGFARRKSRPIRLENAMRHFLKGVASVAALTLVVSLLCGSRAISAQSETPKIVHDAQYYILDAQNGEQWAVEDHDLDARLVALRQKYGRPPNIIHLMWDDQPFGAVGIPALQQLRGYIRPGSIRWLMRVYCSLGCIPSPRARRPEPRR